eukprot:29307-Pelagococcus_subviridis.AAC.4
MERAVEIEHVPEVRPVAVDKVRPVLVARGHAVLAAEHRGEERARDVPQRVQARLEPRAADVQHDALLLRLRRALRDLDVALHPRAMRRVLLRDVRLRGVHDRHELRLALREGLHALLDEGLEPLEVAIRALLLRSRALARELDVFRVRARRAVGRAVAVARGLVVGRVLEVVVGAFVVARRLDIARAFHPRHCAQISAGTGQ